MLAKLLGPMLYGTSTNRIPNDVTRNDPDTAPSLFTVHLDGDRFMEARSNWQRKSLTTPSMPTMRRADSEKLPSSPLRCGPLLTSTSLASNDDLLYSAVEKPSRNALFKQPISVRSVLCPRSAITDNRKGQAVYDVVHGNSRAFDRNAPANGPHSGTSQRPLAAAPRISFVKVPPNTIGEGEDQNRAQQRQ